MSRNKFKPAPWLNLFSVAWIQFTIHDWFDHGSTDNENHIVVPLAADDPLYKKNNG